MDDELSSHPAGMAGDFSRRLLDWQVRHGRHDLPWQGSRDPYRIWLSEIMLQQTRVETVVPYYLRFLQRFPDLPALAAAPLEDVLAAWSGLGYYARARNLHRAARDLVAHHGGRFPRGAAAIAELPGVGRSTAAAIAAFAEGERAAILDGNVKRVLCRVFGVEGFPGSSAVEKRLWTLAEALLPQVEVGRYIQAQMDLGATVCSRSRPDCARCPFESDCVARRSGRVGELPAPRPRKPLPRRRMRVAVITDGQAVLLERRPPTGIWGGLLALPEISATAADSAQWAAERFGLKAGSGSRLAALSHGFTHFTLDLEPVLLHASATATQIADADLRWLALSAIDDAPLPAPVRRILASLAAPDAVAGEAHS